jgi:hypothetical protein
VNDTIHRLNKHTKDWYAHQIETIKTSIINSITANGAPPLVDSDNPCLATWIQMTANNLCKHTRAMLLNDSVNCYVIP